MIFNKILSNTSQLIIDSTEKNYAITTMFFCNVSSENDTINVYAVPKNEEVDDNYLIVHSCNVEGTDTFVLNMEKLIIENGDRIYAKSQNGTIVATLSAMEV